MKDRGFSMRWTAWKVWTHPELSLDILENYYLDSERKEAGILQLTGECTALRDENARLLETQNKLSAEISAVEKENSILKEEAVQLKKELETVRKHLRHQQEIDDELREYDRRLTGIIDMKRKYEQRISELENRLEEEGKMIKFVDSGANGNVIHIPDEGIELSDDLHNTPDAGDQDTDWLMDLSEF